MSSKKKRAPLSNSYRGEVETENRKETEAKLRRLWGIIQRSSPEERKRLIESLDEKTVNALRAYCNPYKKPVFTTGKEKLLAFSFVGMTEKYLERFAMTSLVGFLYRMLDEYEPPGSENYISESEPKFAVPFHQKVKLSKRSLPKEKLHKELSECEEGGKEWFRARCKLLKLREFFFREDFEIIKERFESLKKQVSELREKQNQLGKSLTLLQEKKAKKILWEERKKKHREELRLLGEGSQELQKPLEPEEGMKSKDLKKKVSDYEIEIENKEKLLRKGEENLQELEKEFSEREAQFLSQKARVEKTKKKLQELRERYLAQLSLPEPPFEDLRFLQSRKPKVEKPTRAKVKAKPLAVETELDSLEVEAVELTGEDYDRIVEEVKQELGVEKTAEEYAVEVQNTVELFLDEYLRYNPDNHVRSSYKPNYEDPQRTPLEETREEDSKEKNYERTVIPPADTFFRWKRYTENNYEELRQACDDIYCEKSDFELGIVPLETFEIKNGDKDAAMAEFDRFKRKHANEFDAEVYCATFGNWNLLSSWEINREVRDFYTENTEIVKRIIDQHKEDQRMGVKLMKDRAEKKKRENELQSGKDDPGLQEARKQLQLTSDLEKHGGKHMSEILSPGDIPRDTEESGKEDIEVGVHVIKPYLGGGRRRPIRGESEQWKFHIPSEKLPEGGVEIKNPAQFQKSLAEKEKV